MDARLCFGTLHEYLPLIVDVEQQVIVLTELCGWPLSSQETIETTLAVLAESTDGTFESCKKFCETERDELMSQDMPSF